MAESDVLQFIAWLETFDSDGLHSEDDVVTKFVIPFFQRLGYPETGRRGNYGIDAYARGKKVGNHHAADQVYFSASDAQKQGPDTSLVIVETKAPSETNLANATKQVTFYGAYLKPAFLIVTNGFRLCVLQCRRYHSEVIIFDDDVTVLRDETRATSLYKQLSYEVVCHIKEHGDNVVMHEQYVHLQAALSRYPDVQEFLERGDFHPIISREDHVLTVVRPKVAMECRLPQAFGEGSCSIEFSNVLRRGLTIQLSHIQIIRDLLIGLNTRPDWGSRLFLTPLEDGSYDAQLGGTTTILSADEVVDLCACVDAVAMAYKDNLVEAETKLETWEFQLVETEYGNGFQLLSVPYDFWQHMYAFAQIHDYGDGNSSWHIFERFGPSIRICANPQHLDSAILWPVGDRLLSCDEVHIIYLVPKWPLEQIRLRDSFDWRSMIGSVGTWTATYTKRWLEQEFIPKVCAYYRLPAPKFKRTEGSIGLQDMQQAYTPFELIRTIQELVPYLYDVHYWIARYPTKWMSSTLLQSFYATFADLIQGADKEILTSHYVFSSLGKIDRVSNGYKTDVLEMPKKGSEERYYAMFLDRFKSNVERIHTEEYEDSVNAEYLTRVFTYIIENTNLILNQAQLNAAKQSLRLLWEQRRFEERYVFRALRRHT